MELKDFFLEQLEMEAAASRKALERVPEGHDDGNHMKGRCNWDT